MGKRRDPIPQAAAIPFRSDGNGGIEILLIRRRDKSKWGIPKGLVDPGRTRAETARIEALEEAGIIGELSPRPIGWFDYRKFGGTCRVGVFLMRVRALARDYQERHERIRKWFTLHRAAELAGQQAVRRLISRIPQYVGPSRSHS